MGSIPPIGYINPLRYRGYYYDTELGLYYLQSRFYDPNTGRFINADAYASTGQGIIGHNMFAYCGNDPINRADSAGNAWFGTNTVAINDGGSGNAIAHALSQAHAIGYHSAITEDTISIDLDATISQINYLYYEHGFSLHVICSEISSGACQRYYDMYGYAFLFSDECVTKEVYDHVVAYQWSIGQRFLPNLIGAGWAIKNLSISKVYSATRKTDIRTSDAWNATEFTGFDYYLSQAFFFNYDDGIRTTYVGTSKDPYASQR